MQPYHVLALDIQDKKRSQEFRQSELIKLGQMFDV